MACFWFVNLDFFFFSFLACNVSRLQRRHSRDLGWFFPDQSPGSRVQRSSNVPVVLFSEMCSCWNVITPTAKHDCCAHRLPSLRLLLLQPTWEGGEGGGTRHLSVGAVKGRTRDGRTDGPTDRPTGCWRLGINKKTADASAFESVLLCLHLGKVVTS